MPSFHSGHSIIHSETFEKEFWRPKLKSDRSTRPTWPAPLGAFWLKKNFDGRKALHFGSKRILATEKHCILAQKDFWRLKSIAFWLKKNFGGRKALHFGSKRILADEKHCILLQKEFWRLKSIAFCSKKNFGGRKALHFGSKRILEAERRQGEPAKFAGYHKTNFPDLDTRNGIKERGVCIAAHLLSCYANVSLRDFRRSTKVSRRVQETSVVLQKSPDECRRPP